MALPYMVMNQPQMYMCSPSWTPLLPPSPSHPSGSSQYTSPEHPVSCIKPGLAICFTYDNIHVSMLFSQIIPPSPSSTESKRLFYTSVSNLIFKTTWENTVVTLFCRWENWGPEESSYLPKITALVRDEAVHRQLGFTVYETSVPCCFYKARN